MKIDHRKTRQDPPYQVTVVEIVLNENTGSKENDFEDLTCSNVLNLATDCCEDNLDDDDLDKVSTNANLDEDELPLISRIRIFLTDKRDRVFPLLLIFSGGLASLISVG